MEYPAHLRLRLSCVLAMHHTAVLDGSALDALTLQQDGLPTAEIDIHRFRRQRLLDQTGELIKWKISGSSQLKLERN
jgi:hypothetical protein